MFVFYIINTQQQNLIFLYILQNCIIFIDLQQAEFFLSGLTKVIQKQNSDISMFRNEVGRLQNENKSMLNYYVVP